MKHLGDRIRISCQLLLAGLLTPALCGAAHADWWIESPAWYGVNKGPYSTKPQAEFYNSKFFGGQGIVRGYDSAPYSGSGYGGNYSSNPMANAIGSALQPLANQAGQLIGQALLDVIRGNPAEKALKEAQEAELRRQQEEHRRQQEEARRLERERLVEEARLAEMKRRQEFAEKKRQMLAQMKGIDGRAFDGAGLGGSTEVKLKPVKGIFGTTELKHAADGTITLKEIELNPRPKPLSEPPPIVPAPVETAESKAAAERLKYEVAAFDALENRAKQQESDFRKLDAEVKVAEKQVQEAQQQKQDAQKEKDELELKQQQDPSTEPSSAMQEALEALQKAEQAEVEAESGLNEKQQAKTDIEKQLQDTINTLKTTKPPPGSASENVPSRKWNGLKCKT